VALLLPAAAKPEHLAMSSLAKLGQTWTVAEHHLYPRYYCQGPVAKSILLKKEENEGYSKFVLTKQAITDKRICSFTLLITEGQRRKGLKCQQELSIFG